MAQAGLGDQELFCGFGMFSACCGLKVTQLLKIHVSGPSRNLGQNLSKIIIAPLFHSVKTGKSPKKNQKKERYVQNRSLVCDTGIGILKRALIRLSHQNAAASGGESNQEGRIQNEHHKETDQLDPRSSKCLCLWQPVEEGGPPAGSTPPRPAPAQAPAPFKRGGLRIQPELDSSVDYTQGDSYSFIIATDGAEDRVDGLLVHYMADQLNAITGGRIQLQMYFNGSMGTDTELCESTQAGDVASSWSTAFTANFVPELNANRSPFPLSGCPTVPGYHGR